MRNLKRALSLTLASVMLLGMMVVGSSALSFNDADDITNVTAASVLEDLGIMQGDGSGNFMPDKAVTRAQMAIIVCRILYGNKLNVSQFEGTTQYTDVGANDYYTGYINLATQLGIIGGYGDGRFGPNDTVTTAQAALMLSRALGYFKGNEIAQASDWALAAVAQATKINMFGNLNLSTNAELARDNVAEMVFNAITATVPVQYNELLGVYYNENQGIIYALNFNYLETLGYKNFDLVYRDDTQDIYGRPARTWGTGTYNTTTTQQTGGTRKDQSLDAQGGLIASRVRMLDKNEIITVALTPDYVYTDKKDQDEVWKDLGRTLCNESSDPDKGYIWSAYVNGELVYETGSSAKNAYYGYGDANYVPENLDESYVMTGKGAQTEIYVDDGDATVTVVEINYYLGEVTRVSDDTITVKALSLEPTRLNIRTANAAGYDVEDLVVFTVDENEDEDFYICEVFEPQTETGTIKRVESNTDSEDSYVRFEVGGDKYSYSGNNHIVYDLDNLNVREHPTLEEEYTLFMDPNGYVLAFELAEDETLNYLYVKDSDEEMFDWVAKVIYADATVAKVDVKEDLKSTPSKYNNNDGVDVLGPYNKVHWVDNGGYQKNENTSIDGMVWKYSKNTSGAHTLTWAEGVYLADNTITGIAADPEIDIFNGRAYIGTGRRVIVDQKTVFVDVENERSYTGYDAVPTVHDAELIYVLDRKGVADVVFILDGDIYDDGFYFALEGTARESWLRGGKGGDRYWHYTKSYVDGLKEDIYVDYTNAGGEKDELVPGVLYKATRIEEDEGIDYIEKVEVVADFRDVADTEAYSALADENLQNMRVSYARKNGYSFSLVDDINKKDLQYTTDGDTRFVLVEQTYKKNGITPDGWSISKGSINDLEVIDYREKLNTYVTVAQEDGNEVAEVVYILKTNTRYPVVLTDATGASKTFWARMTQWNDATRTPVAEINIPASELGGTISNLVVTGDVTNDLHQDAAGNLVGTVTISDTTAGEKLSITGTIDKVEIEKPDAGKVTIKANEGVTYTVNGEASTATSVDVKDGETVTVAATLKNGYKWTDTTITGTTWTATAKGGETITIPATEKLPVTFKLTLAGDFDGAEVYVNNNPTEADDTEMTGAGDTRIWNIAEGAKVIVELPSGTTLTDSLTTYINGVKVVINKETKRAELTMTNDVELTSLPTVADRVWTVVVEDGVSVKWMKDGTDVSAKVTQVDANTYQVPESAEVNNIKIVSSANTSGAIVTDDGTCMLASDARSWTVAKGGAEGDSLSLTDISKDKTLYVFAASKIKLEDSLTADEFHPNLGSETTVWARPGVTLTIYADTTNGDGIIVQRGNTTRYADYNPDKGEFLVGEEDITLRQGWKVTLNGVTATVTETGEKIESGMRVANGKDITVTIPTVNDKATASHYLVDMSGDYAIETGSDGKTTGTDVTVSTRTSLTAVTKVELPDDCNIKLTYNDDKTGATGLEITEVAGSGGSNAKTLYVLPGKTIIAVTGAGTGNHVKITGKPQSVTVNGVSASITIGGEALKLETESDS